jgi:hypothetical protein
LGGYMEESREKNRLKFKDWFIPLLLVIAGGLSSWIISCAQMNNTRIIAENDQKIKIIEIFSNKLTGDRYDREIAVGLIKTLSDTQLTNKLLRISDLITIDKLQDSIWSKNEKSRIDAIIEYAKLYKKYPRLVVDALLPRFDTHLANIEPMISIAQIFW